MSNDSTIPDTNKLTSAQGKRSHTEPIQEAATQLGSNNQDSNNQDSSRDDLNRDDLHRDASQTYGAVAENVEVANYESLSQAIPHTVDDGEASSCNGLSDWFMELSDVSRIYKAKYSSAEEVVALSGVNLTMNAGERLALLGKSGSGKSTLLNLLGGLDQPTSGKIIVDQHDVTSLDSQQMANYRQKSVGMIFQAFNLIPTKTATQNVEMPFVFQGVGPTVRRAKSRQALDAVGLSKRAKHRPAQLSGGEQQRVAIARAIANQPALLLADEPTGNLDSATAKEIMQLLVNFSNENNTAIILVTHDEDLAQEFAHRIVRLRDGAVVETV